MDLKELKKEIPYKWRVQSFSKNKAKASVVAYIDSRDAQRLLDEVVGPENWQDKYYEAGGLLFCAVGIKCGDDWVWKSDTGSESNQDKEKGHASDAFKRACVKWGIGRFLYDLKILYLDTNGAKSDSNRYPHVVDGNGKKVWDVNEYVNKQITENNW